MHGRMIHGRSKLGEIYEESQEYDVHGRVRFICLPYGLSTTNVSKSIFAVDRAGLNKRLLDSLESMPNVTFHFNHKLTGADFNENKAWFEKRRDKPRTDHAQNPTQPSRSKQDEDRDPEIEIGFDLMIGADGAHSAARYHLMKFARVNYQQEYIDTLWCEFHISPKNSDFAMSPNHLHIWPGGSFMFIAIPSLDKSFTCTLFAPAAIFNSISESISDNLPSFFAEHLPGVSPQLINKSDLVSQFSQNPHLPLISIKCRPHHYKSSVVIVGDAAHAMVPFYGQGMNAGLEDIRVLFEFFDSYGVYTAPNAAIRKEIRKKALEAYTKFRTPDAASINDLALRNYHEMSSAVTSPLYRARKYVEETINKHFPFVGWSTQYTRVSFGNDRYSEVEKQAERQGRLLLEAAGLLGLGMVGVLGFSLWTWRNPRINVRGTGGLFSWIVDQTKALISR